MPDHAAAPRGATPEPPPRAGQRVRCAIDTLAHRIPARFYGEQLCGRAGTIERVEWYAPLGRGGSWQVSVRYDHLTDATTGYRAPILHDPEDLVPTEEWP